MSADLTGKFVVVSSMGTQVGASIADGLAAAGAQVMLADQAQPEAGLSRGCPVRGASRHGRAELGEFRTHAGGT